MPDFNSLIEEYDEELDPMFFQSVDLCIKANRASTPFLDRRLKIGFGRAEAIVELMTGFGIVGSRQGYSKDRPVLVTDEGDIRFFEECARKERELDQCSNDASERLIGSEDYKFVSQFVRKYGEQWEENDFARLVDLLASRGYKFLPQHLEEVTRSEFKRQYFEEVTNKILRVVHNNPRNRDQLIRAYLEFYHPYGSELDALNRILAERGFELVFNPSELGGAKQKIELENFEKRLLSEGDERVTLAEIDGFNGYEFEKFLTQLFSKMGYEVEQTKLSGDQGADVVVIKFGDRTVIQAKRFQGNVGNYAVQEIMAAISLYKAHKGMVITNSYFTKSAKELATANKIELVDRDALEKLIRDNW